MSPLDRRLAAQLEALEARALYRRRRTVDGPHAVEMQVDGRRCINFCSNDYLGLAADPRMTEALSRGLEAGVGSGAASLVSGYNREHRGLEEELAAFLGRPRVLLFSSGWAANLGVLRALCSRDDRIIADELNHASLIDGGRLSGAEYWRVQHRSLNGFTDALVAPLRQAEGHRLVVTDSVFSMDGDRADLVALTSLCREQGASLMVDDAHGFGVLGPGGRGAVEECGPAADPDVYVATLGKSLGASGAFVAGSETLIEYLIQRARTWVFSTAPPPAVAAAARAALKILIAEPERRQALHSNVRQFMEGARQRGLPVGLPDGGSSDTPIQPLIVGQESKALALSAGLMERGYWVAAIRPPTVPPGTARLRITLSAAHRREHIEGLLDALVEAWRGQPPSTGGVA